MPVSGVWSLGSGVGCWVLGGGWWAVENNVRRVLDSAALQGWEGWDPQRRGACERVGSSPLARRSGDAAGSRKTRRAGTQQQRRRFAQADGGRRAAGGRWLECEVVWKIGSSEDGRARAAQRSAFPGTAPGRRGPAPTTNHHPRIQPLHTSTHSGAVFCTMDSLSAAVPRARIDFSHRLTACFTHRVWPSDVIAPRTDSTRSNAQTSCSTTLENYGLGPGTES
ncbi:uncharacterized protein EKO05_0008233 [Ascochyta rabiei]|uniref:uncharacterized protein n=1 Tax=Didymella rabiei TaxID=5454 RepID=UPI001901026E|nr:uncharacterized protein EKO05_0008233 [Ascochyta rabiei]UPX17906.1 hypothetical protein EKO05_0008233 [Ascochyta rabiei]